MASSRILFSIFALMSSAALAEDSISPTFCQRLAPQLGMRQGQLAQPPSGRDPIPLWQVNLLGGVGAFLFGGQAVASFGLEPVDQDSLAEYKRVREGCRATPKGAVCNIEGPAILHVSTKRGEVSQEAAPGEQAIVGMAKTTITYRDLKVG
jgi:hypothetical protein